MKRLTVVLVVALAALVAVVASRSAGARDAQTLRALADPDGLRIGTAVKASALANDPAYRDLVGEQFSTVTPEDVMKWQNVEPTQGTYDWDDADALVNFAEQHGQAVRGHTLVWHNQLPGWLTGGSFTPAQLRSLLHKHVVDEVRHFKGRIWQWDVVNEAVNDDGTPRDTIWRKAFGGDSYIADAFRWAHEADPQALLFYNDYATTGIGPKSTAVYSLVSQLRAAGVPIDGVGFQTHLDVQYEFPPTTLANLQRFAALGVDVAITEADVRVNVPATAAELQAQAGYYSQALQACLAVPRCISYTVWGFTDEYSWVPYVYPDEGAACLYDRELQPKPAYDAVAADLEQGRP